MDEAMIERRLHELRAETVLTEDQVADTEAQLESARRIGDAVPALHEVVESVGGRLEEADFDLKRLALEALQVRVKVTRGNVEIAGSIPLLGGEPGKIGHHWTNMGITTWV